RSMLIPENVEAFYASLSAKVRKNLKYQAKKLVNDFKGDARVVCYQSSNDLDIMIRDAESIAQKTYQRALGVGFADNAETRARMKLETENGWSRSYILYLEKKPVAFWLGVAYKNVFHSNYMGYDPAIAKYSPGMYLVTTVIEQMSTET